MLRDNTFNNTWINHTGPEEYRPAPRAHVKEAVLETTASNSHPARRITVPVDMSSGSAVALRLASGLAPLVDGTLQVLYVMDRIFAGERSSSFSFLSGYNKTMQTELNGFVNETLAEAKSAPQNFIQTAIGAQVIFGLTGQALIDHSRNTDLLVMGMAGRGSLGRKLFGSVSAEVSTGAHCPVLLVPSNCQYKGFNNVLCVSNFDLLTSCEAASAIEFLLQFSTQLDFAHVGPKPEKKSDYAAKVETTYRRRVSADQPFRLTDLSGPDAVGQLDRYSQAKQTDLMVFVTSQTEFWQHILHQSINREILFDSSMPVLVMQTANGSGSR